MVGPQLIERVKRGKLGKKIGHCREKTGKVLQEDDGEMKLEKDYRREKREMAGVKGSILTGDCDIKRRSR